MENAQSAAQENPVIMDIPEVVTVPTKASVKEFRCDLCPRTFINPQSLGRHKAAKHGISGSSASALASRKARLQAKGMSVAPKSKSKVPKRCPECHVYYQDPRAMGTHRRLAHGVLGSSRSTIAARKRELALVNKPTGKVSCDVCGKSLSSQWAVKVHKQAKHSGRKNLQKLMAEPTILEQEKTNGAATSLGTESNPNGNAAAEAREFFVGQAYGHISTYIDYFCQQTGGHLSPSQLANRLAELLHS